MQEYAIKIVCLTSGAVLTGQLQVKKMKSKQFPTQCIMENSKWIKPLNARLKCIKLSEENVGRTRYNINRTKILYDSPPRVMEIKTKINKWNRI